ncbi:MAG: hypothetical protein A2020_05595 [Lentisphaerae bacterium GWF2_45_14]|nr:MAG: hypothetical protein A2020_05595 [Lentisphaerae bacterium GWF2_45_14]
MKRILLAEDEEAVRKYLALLLEKNDYKVKAVDNGKKALELIDASVNGLEEPFDLLITDIEMPLMDGFSLIDAIKERNIFLPVIVITGQDDRDVVLNALRRGCHEFIDKPLMPDVIAKVKSTFDKIEKVSGQRSSRDMADDTQRFGHPQTASLKVPYSKMIGKYNIKRVIGEGGIGTVFLCEDPETKQHYALKTLRLRTLDDDKDSSIRRLINEGSAISQLNHPNIVNFIEFGYSGIGHDRMPYIVMEYFEGMSLRHFMEGVKELSIAQKLSIISQVAEGLYAAHQRNICHRDIKPDNILVNNDLEVKITDFGICYLPTSDVTRTSELMGSPGYMAPEYIRHGKTDKAMDIYSLGVVAYELLVGRKPFEATTLTDLMNKIINSRPPEPSRLVPGFPPELQRILAVMLRKNPKKRYKDGTEIIQNIDAFLNGKTGRKMTDRIREFFHCDWH